ncbi:Heme-binding protein A [subsurface metagenome]
MWHYRFSEPIQERPLIGDFEKYGPRGTGEFAFQLMGYVPAKFLTGQLLESWEVTPEKLVWHVRPGIMWQPGHTGIMEARELTADDIVDRTLAFIPSPQGKTWIQYAGDVYAVDRYTLVIEFKKFSIDLMFYMGLEDRSQIPPPEERAPGIGDKWEQQAGTGPFMIKEYVVGSHMSYERNPNWWKTTTINGVEYELPFIDELVYPILPDDATQVAALRTGKIDLHQMVPVSQWQTLETGTPELLSAHYSFGGMAAAFNCAVPPLDKREVRRALMIGTDLKTVAATQGLGPLPIDWYPAYIENPDIYTPLEELPAESQFLYDYNPELAKQMLADAGYPDGFPIVFNVVPYPQLTEVASLLKDMWTKINVDVEVKVTERVTLHTIAYDQFNPTSYTGLCSWGDLIEVGNPTASLVRMARTGGDCNFAKYSNKDYDELTDKIATELDITKRNLLIKEACGILIDDPPYLPLYAEMRGHYWWPWLKNYYGEMTIGDGGFGAIAAYIWIDQDMKADMGY